MLLGAIVLVLSYLAAVAAVEGARLPDLASPGALLHLAISAFDGLHWDTERSGWPL